MIRTSESAQLYDTTQFTNLSSVRELLEGYEEGKEKLPLAVRVQGKAGTAFPDGMPQLEASQQLATATSDRLLDGDIDVIMIADTDFLHDRFWVNRQHSLGQTLLFAEASNGEFINNAIDNLSGDNALIGVRTRGRSLRPFVATQGIRQAAEKKYLQHESELKGELARIETFLADFAATRSESAGKVIISDAQRNEIKQIRENQLSIRRQLREVQHKLVKDIQMLENRLILLNMLLVPVVLAIAGAFICTAGVRHRDRRLAARICAAHH